MFTAQQAREAQQAQEAIQAEIAAEEARKKEAEAQSAAEALAAKNIEDAQEIFDKAQLEIELAAGKGKAEVVFFAGFQEDGAYVIASKMLADLGFTAKMVEEEVQVPMNDPDMQGMNDYMRATGELKVFWAA